MMPASQLSFLESEEISLNEKIRRDLVSNRSRFYSYIDRLSNEDLSRATSHPRWNIKAVLFHLAEGLSWVPAEVKAVRRGKALQPMPAWLFDLINTWLTVFGARNQTIHFIVDYYENAYREALMSLESVGEDEWNKKARFHKFETTLEGVFRRQTEHHKEHLDQIETALMG